RMEATRLVRSQADRRGHRMEELHHRERRRPPLSCEERQWSLLQTMPARAFQTEWLCHRVQKRIKFFCCNNPNENPSSLEIALLELGREIKALTEQPEFLDELKQMEWFQPAMVAKIQKDL